MKIVFAVLFAIAIAVTGGVAYLAALRFDAALQRVDRAQDLQAIQDCAMAYRQERTNALTGVITIRPLEQQVRECAWQKGVTWDGVWSDLPATPATPTIPAVRR